MTQLVQTQRRNPALTLASVAVAAALFVGVVGIGAQAIVQEDAKAKAAYQAKWAAYGAAWEWRYRAQRGAGYVSPHDKVVLKAAKEWEIRYRAMYPNS
jgi:cell division protein FtsN